ncbi:MAG: hypothetical protein HGB34_02605 [Candidatus Moranbacteria bacterium]|nr:hypothetical protein [Candidatus Moranbacteria bacterium]NTW75770.1 hypothetical protein [Candidatus Moranbacteria bacterium]
MPKQNALVVESGDLFENIAVIEWLKQQQNTYHITLLIGAGKQTNTACAQAGYKRKFCPLGRIYENAEHRQLGERIARETQSLIQDQLDQEGLSCRVLIPFDTSDDVVTPVNGDVAMFGKYLGYDKIFRLTRNERVKDKEELIRKVALAFSPVAGPEGIDMYLSKISVIGF